MLISGLVRSKGEADHVVDLGGERSISGVHMKCLFTLREQRRYWFISLIIGSFLLNGLSRKTYMHNLALIKRKSRYSLKPI